MFSATCGFDLMAFVGERFLASIFAHLSVVFVPSWIYWQNSADCSTIQWISWLDFYTTAWNFCWWFVSNSIFVIVGTSAAVVC